jgi:hypothetical protein
MRRILAMNSVNVEEIDREEPARLSARSCATRYPRGVERGRYGSSGGYGQSCPPPRGAQADQITLDTPVPPSGIFLSQTDNQIPEFS